MHLHFFVRGETHCVDNVLNWIKTRTILIPYWDNEEDFNAGKKPTYHPSSYILRYSVLGSYELIIPEHEADKWLTTLGFDKLHPNTAKMRAGLALLRKAMGIKKAPKFSKDEQVMLPEEHRKWCGFIPIGIKYDGYSQFSDGFHEAL